MICLSQRSSDWGRYFKQNIDIDFGTDETVVDWDGNGTENGEDTEGFLPIGNATTKFTGLYDGDGHIIANLFINRIAHLPNNHYQALFGSTSSESVIGNLGLIDNTVMGYHNVGGLVGNNDGSVGNSYATGTVVGYSNVGGLVGYNHGFIGNSYTTGRVEGAGSSIGGLVGENFSGSVNNSYAMVAVVGYVNVGGLAGRNFDGFIGNSYAMGRVIGGHYTVGGLVGNSVRGSVIDSYWDTETSGQDGSYGGGTGLTTAQFYSNDRNFNDNFVSKWRFGNPSDYSSPWIASPADYPRLSTNIAPTTVVDCSTHPTNYSGGSGTDTVPYQIASPEDLICLSQRSDDWGKFFEQSKDIDFGASVTSMIGENFSPGEGFNRVWLCAFFHFDSS